jgi:hypothetical protein
VVSREPVAVPAFEIRRATRAARLPCGSWFGAFPLSRRFTLERLVLTSARLGRRGRRWLCLRLCLSEWHGGGAPSRPAGAFALSRLGWRDPGRLGGLLRTGPACRHGGLGLRRAASHTALPRHCLNRRPRALGLALCPSEYLVPEADYDANQHQERQQRDADRDHDKQQAAGNNTRYQQPDCDEHDRQDDAEPVHARTPLERLGPA